MAEVVDEVVGFMFFGEVEVAADIATEGGGFAEVGFGDAGVFAKGLGHECEAAVGFEIDSVGAEAFDGGGVGMVEDVGIVPKGGVVNGLVIARYAVLEDCGAGEEAVGGVETLGFEFAHSEGRAAVGLAEKVGVEGDEVVVVGSYYPEYFVPILVSDAERVFGYAPEGLLGDLWPEEADSIPAVDGTVASPLAAVSASSVDEAVVGVVVHSPYGKPKSTVDERVVGLQILTFGT